MPNSEISRFKMIYYIHLAKYEMVHKMWSHDFRCSRFGLDHHTPHEFVRCFWQKSELVPAWWVSYKAVLMVYYIITWILSFINFGREVPHTDDKYFIYLTNWSYSLNTVLFMVSTVLVILRYIQERSKSFTPGNPMVIMPWYYKFYWALHTICLPVSVGVSGIFWGAVYNPERHPIDVVNLTTHLFNSITLLVDFFLLAHPFRILHVYLPVAYTLVYLFFTVIYFLAGGTAAKGETAIYAILNWERPGYAILTSFLGIVFLSLVHVVYWLLHKLKQLLRTKCISSKESNYKEGEENLGMEDTHPSKLDIV